MLPRLEKTGLEELLLLPLLLPQSILKEDAGEAEAEAEKMGTQLTMIVKNTS